MLRIENVTRTFKGPSGPLTVLHDVSLGLEAGEFVAIKGHSGSGKSTLLLIAGGLLAPSGGNVVLNGIDLYRAGATARAEIRATTAGFVFQEFHLIPYLTVTENILAACCGKLTAHVRRRAYELTERLGLSSRAAHVPSQLSAGEQQRTALARALLNEPRVLFADEPTGNLDEQNAGIVLDQFRQFTAVGGAVLLVTHDNTAAAAAGRIVRLEQGRIAA